MESLEGQSAPLNAETALQPQTLLSKANGNSAATNSLSAIIYPIPTPNLVFRNFKNETSKQLPPNQNPNLTSAKVKS